jgi:hypothetical protein
VEIRRLDFVRVPSRDGERTRKSYVETLGLQPAKGTSGSESQVRDVFRRVAHTGVCQMALFRDPDGNDLMLHNRYAPHAG